ncbi:MAG: hypothetical protein ACK4I8_00265 [Armatimonadota bacterium]
MRLLPNPISKNGTGDEGRGISAVRQVGRSAGRETADGQIGRSEGRQAGRSASRQMGR